MSIETALFTEASEQDKDSEEESSELKNLTGDDKKLQRLLD